MTVPKPVTENAVFWYYFRHLISRRVATSAGLCHKPCFLDAFAYSALNLFARRFLVAISSPSSIRQASPPDRHNGRDFALANYDEQTRITRSKNMTNVGPPDTTISANRLKSGDDPQIKHAHLTTADYPRGVRSGCAMRGEPGPLVLRRPRKTKIGRSWILWKRDTTSRSCHTARCRLERVLCRHALFQRHRPADTDLSDTKVLISSSRATKTRALYCEENWQRKICIIITNSTRNISQNQQDCGLQTCTI